MKTERLPSSNSNQIKLRVEAEEKASDGEPDALHAAGIRSVTIVVDNANTHSSRRYAISSADDVSIDGGDANGFIGIAPESADEALAESIVARWLRAPGK